MNLPFLKVTRERILYTMDVKSCGVIEEVMKNPPFWL